MANNIMTKAVMDKIRQIPGGVEHLEELAQRWASFSEDPTLKDGRRDAVVISAALAFFYASIREAETVESN